MHKNIVWSPLSEIDLENIFDYLQNEWSQEVVIRFLDKVEILINQIAKNPKQFPIVTKPLWIENP